MLQHASLHRIGWLVDAGHVPAATCSVRAKMTVSAVAVAGRVRGAGDAPCVSNMSTPASSSTVSTAAMMVVISASRWANLSADQQQLQQVATEDGRLGTAAHQKGYMAEAGSACSRCPTARYHTARCRVCCPHLSGWLRRRAGLAMYPFWSRERKMNVLYRFCTPAIYL